MLKESFRTAGIAFIPGFWNGLTTRLKSSNEWPMDAEMMNIFLKIRRNYHAGQDWERLQNLRNQHGERIAREEMT